MNMKMNTFSTGLVKAVALSVISIIFSSAYAVPVTGVATADNAYGFGFGTVSGMTNYFGGIRNTTAGQIFSGAPVLFTGNVFPWTNGSVGPESYAIDVVDTDYVYMVAWSDKAVTQGIIAGFQLPDGTLLTSNKWQVFATGLNKNSNIAADTLTAADINAINTEIGTANTNSGGPLTSKGWVNVNGLLPDGTPGVGKLAVGEVNSDPSGNFPIIQGISPAANWLWYNSNNAANPFSASSAGSTGHREYLIFRTKASDFLPPQSVYVSGSSSSTNAVFRAFQSNCTDTDTDGTPNVRVYTSGGGALLPGSLDNEMAYECIFKGTAPVFPNKVVIMHHVVKGGSFNAFAPHLNPADPTSAYPGHVSNPDVPQPLEYNSTTHTFTNCVDIANPELNVDLWNGCKVTTGAFVNAYNGGFSDVEANMWSSTLATLNDLQALALTSFSAGVQQVFGIVVTDELYKAMQLKQLNDGLLPGCTAVLPTFVPGPCQPNLPKADYAGIVALSGGYHKNWEFLLGAPAGTGKNVNLCRRVTTSGTQASSNYHFLGTPCSQNPINGGSREPAYAADSTATFNVAENSSTTNVKTCLTTRNNTVGQEYGIGFMSMENVSGIPDRWKFVKVNGVSPNEDSKQRRQAARGNYDLVSEMVYFVKPGSSVFIQDFFAKSLAANLVNLDLTGLMVTPRSATATTGPVPNGDKVARSTREGNSCSTLYRNE